MRVLVFGCGALGSLFAGLLSRRHDVVLVARRAHVEAVRRDGLRITGRTEEVARPRAVERVEGETPPDVVLVTVKAYDTGEAMAALRPFWETSAFLSLQNGLGNEDLLAERAKRVLGGVTSQGVTFVKPGEVFHAGVGETAIGPYREAARGDAPGVVEAFQACDIPCRQAEDIHAELWVKAIVNASINPLTALLRVPNGAVARSATLRAIVEEVVEEGVRAAAAHEVLLGKGEVLGRVWATAEATAENRSSMLQDLEAGRRTEIAAINGALVERGSHKGIPCPANALLTRLVQAAEEAGRRDATLK